MTLSIQNISKTYPNQTKALNAIELEINTGMFGLLGPNGAGKSSLMRTIATLQFPDTGNILFEGKDIFEHKHWFRSCLGYLPQEFGVYKGESADSLLNYFALLKGIASKKDRRKAIDHVLSVTNLLDARKKKVSNYSGGMLRRFGIAQLLLTDTKLIIVDEPTAGLDPEERIRFLNILRKISQDKVVIFSTHLVEDVKHLCNEMAIINNGKLMSSISPSKAIESLNGKIWEVDEIDTDEDHSSIKLSDAYDENNQLISRIFSEKPLSENCKMVKPKLEDYYFLTLKQQS